MTKKIGIIIVGAVLALTFILFALCLIGNGHNSVGNANPDCIQWFEDTGIDVKSHQHRLFHIVRDGNGYLYYMSDIENALTPVVNEFGLPTKDINIFQH